MTNEVVLRLADMCDGWTILKSEAVAEAGLPAEAVELLTKTFDSDISSDKRVIFAECVPIKNCRGIYSLELLEWLAAEIDADTSGVIAIGRGTMAEQFKAAIRRACGECQLAAIS